MVRPMWCATNRWHGVEWHIRLVLIDARPVPKIMTFWKMVAANPLWPHTQNTAMCRKTISQIQTKSQNKTKIMGWAPSGALMLSYVCVCACVGWQWTIVSRRQKFWHLAQNLTFGSIDLLLCEWRQSWDAKFIDEENHYFSLSKSIKISLWLLNCWVATCLLSSSQFGIVFPSQLLWSGMEWIILIRLATVLCAEKDKRSKQKQDLVEALTPHLEICFVQQQGNRVWRQQTQQLEFCGEMTRHCVNESLLGDGKCFFLLNRWWNEVSHMCHGNMG